MSQNETFRDSPNIDYGNFPARGALVLKLTIIGGQINGKSRQTSPDAPATCYTAAIRPAAYQREAPGQVRQLNNRLRIGQ